MVSKFFSIILFLSSLPSFATDTPFISEEDTDVRKITQASQILNAIINTGKLLKDMTDSERKFLEEQSKEHCIDFTRTFKSLSYAGVIKNKSTQKIVRQNTILDFDYFSEDVDRRSVVKINPNVELPLYQDDKNLYEGYISMAFQINPLSISESSDDQKKSSPTNPIKKNSVSKTASSSKKSKKHVRKTSENLTFPEINSSKDNKKILEKLDTDSDIKTDVPTLAPQKIKKSSKSGFGMTCFGKKSK